jgi:hypothetical protein
MGSAQSNTHGELRTRRAQRTFPRKSKFSVLDFAERLEACFQEIRVWRRLRTFRHGHQNNKMQSYMFQIVR